MREGGRRHTPGPTEDCGTPEQGSPEQGSPEDGMRGQSPHPPLSILVAPCSGGRAWQGAHAANTGHSFCVATDTCASPTSGPHELPRTTQASRPNPGRSRQVFAPRGQSRSEGDGEKPMDYASCLASSAPSPGSTTSSGCSSSTSAAPSPRGLPCPRLLPRLLQEAPTIILIRVLSTGPLVRDSCPTVRGAPE